MPNIAANKKHLRKSIKREERNKAIKSKIKTIYNSIVQTLSTKDSINNDKIMARLAFFYKIGDKAVVRGIFKRKTIARKKSKLAKKILQINKK